MNTEYWRNYAKGEKTEVLGEKMCCSATCPLQIPRGLASDQTQTLMVGGKCVLKVTSFMEDMAEAQLFVK